MKKYIAMVMVLGFLIASVPQAKAVTLLELQKQVQSLTEQVKLLSLHLKGQALGALDSSITDPIKTSPVPIVDPVKTDPAPNPIATAGVLIYTPNGGESYIVGKTINVTWKTVGLTNSDLIVIKMFNKVGSTYSNAVTLVSNTTNDGNETVTIPSTTVLGSTYVIQVSIPAKNVNDYSNNTFSIVSNTTPTPSTSTITVLAPNGGETYTSGQQITVTWKTTDILATQNVSIQLLQQQTTPYGTDILVASTPNDGSETVTIPTSSTTAMGSGYIYGKNYKINVAALGINDFSNSTFTIMSTDNVTCNLIINNLCYNSSYVKNINNTAQIKDFNPNTAIVITSEPDNQPKSYTLNSSVSRKFYIKNNSSSQINVKVRSIFYPYAVIEYGTHAIGIPQTDLPLQTIALGSQETKEINLLVPTSQLTLSANILIHLDHADSFTGISYPYFSKPFSIYNSQDPFFTTTCHGYTVQTNFSSYVCNNDVFIPLGNIGCTSSGNNTTGKVCIENHLFPSLSRDRSAENIKMLVANVYLTDDQNAISDYEQKVGVTLLELSNKIFDIKSKTGNPKNIIIDQKKCNANRNSVLDFLNQIDPNSSWETKTDGLLSLCGLSRVNYTHTFINFYDGISDSEKVLIGNKIYSGPMARALYVGNGIFFSSIASNQDWVTIDDWVVILHEVTHSFGAPDLYIKNYVFGSTYLWGNCQLMKAEPFDQDTPLCPLESIYWSSNAPTTTSTYIQTPLNLKGSAIAKSSKSNLPIQNISTKSNISGVTSLPSGTSSSSMILKRGVKSTEVLEMQKALLKLGYDVTADGSFGPKTETAVKSFQTANGFKVDGKVGPVTKAILLK